MEKRSQSRHQPDTSLRCKIEWEKGVEEGQIHNISTRGALLEASSDFGISRIKLILDFEPMGETIRLEASIRWHAVSPQDETDHYGLVFRNLDEDTQEKLDKVIEILTDRSSATTD